MSTPARRRLMRDFKVCCLLTITFILLCNTMIIALPLNQIINTNIKLIYVYI